MVVHDVHDHRDAGGVAGVDESLQRVGASVRVVHRVEVDAVVPPAALARERGHRQQLDRADAEVDEVADVLDGAVERAGAR